MKIIKIKKNNTRATVDKNVKKSNVYNIFKGSEEKNKNISFNGKLDIFMYNPIANTSILDGVITATRLKEARHGERKEVALKEAFQIFFIYAIAKPTQFLFEKIGRKFDLPVELDPKILFSKNVKEEISNAANYIKQSGIDMLDNEELLSKVHKIAGTDIKNPLIQALNKNDTIEIISKGNTQTYNYLKNVEAKDIKETIKNILELDKHIGNLKGIKAYKIFSVLSNIAIGALAMGVLQPLVNIGMRKLLNNGDNRNPAIVAQEKQLQFLANQN